VTGLLIALAELAVGVGTLLGLLSRAAAVGGLLLALSFFLTVSWNTRPYYFGPDIVFVFAWLPFVVVGDGGVFSLASRFRARARRAMQLPEVAPGHETEYVLNEVERRTILGSAALAAGIAVVVAPAGAVIALARRPSSGSTASATPSTTPSPSATGAATNASPSGTSSAGSSPAASQSTGPVIAAASAVAVGASKQFTAPNGDPAFLLHPSTSSYVAFSAVCTHEGCPVSFVGPGFQCPCHGATYDAAGQPTGGPANGPLTAIPVAVKDGNVVVA
jgi:thiosulfate dehydrogenase [quinone] large subunit